MYGIILFPNFVSSIASATRELKKKLSKAMEEREKFNELFLEKIHADGKKNKYNINIANLHVKVLLQGKWINTDSFSKRKSAEFC